MNEEVIIGWNRKKLLVLTTVVGVLVILTWYINEYASLDVLVLQEARVRHAIAQHPWSSFMIGLMIYTVVSLVPGTSGKSVVFGWLYGFSRGSALIITGLTCAAMVMFYLSRYVLQGWFEHRYARFLAALNRHLKKEGAFYLLTLRMAHFPFSIINLASGASRVKPQTFCWTTSLGLIPGTAVFAYVGSRLPSLTQLIADGSGALVDTPLIVALCASAIFPLAFRIAAQRVGLLKDTGSSNDTVQQQPTHRSLP